jgi:hypothetical protein
MPYTINAAPGALEQAVEDWLYGLDRVSSDLRSRIVTAWASSIGSSTYTSIDDIPFTAGQRFYPLASHVNEVTRAGIDLGRRAEVDWGITLNWDEMLAILILHDVDKPLLYEAGGEGGHGHTRLFHELPHGVVGAMMLKDLGFSHLVVSTVGTHATNTPFHGDTPEAQILHYADLFAADRAMKVIGEKPFYQRGFGTH